MKLNYLVFGTNQMEAATGFYDSLFAELGATKLMTGERMTFWQGEGYTFALALPFDENPSSNGNGTMAGFEAGSPEEVKRLHAKVIELGGSCEGEPGDRGPMYAAYTRDLDSNKITFYTMTP